jgi:Family of unknown function (DUF6518)
VLPVAVVVGIALGVFSTLADGILPGRLFTLLGNIAAPWALAPSPLDTGRRPRSRARSSARSRSSWASRPTTRGRPSAATWSGELNVVWTVVALVAGPVVGACGAAISIRREHPPLVAVVVPGAMLVAEGLFLLYDRKVWRTNFGAEPYRLIDVGVALALVLGGFVLPWVFAERGRRLPAFLGVAGVGVLGAFGFVVLERIIVAVV